MSDFIFVVAWLIYGWLAAVAGHAIGRTRREPIIHKLPEPVKDPLDQLAWQCVRIISDGMRDQLPTRWLARRPFPLLDMCWARRGTTTVLDGEMLLVDDFQGEVDIDSRDIMSLDPAGRFEKAAERLLARLRVANVRAFVKLEVPPGLDYAAVMIDPTTGIRLLCIRGYDITKNEFITILRVRAAVKS